MAVDPMMLVQASRPGPAIDIGTPERGAIRRARRSVIEDHSGQNRDPAELEVNPGNAAYRSKIPNPPCKACGADHNPLHEAQGRYNHPYLHPESEASAEVLTATGALPEGVSVQPVPAVGVSPTTTPLAIGAPAKRMTLFPGKQDDTYLLMIEERQGDDWEDVQGFVLANTLLTRVLPIFDLLGLKIKDRTGGDLVMLRNPNDAG